MFFYLQTEHAVSDSQQCLNFSSFSSEIFANVSPYQDHGGRCRGPQQQPQGGERQKQLMQPMGGEGGGQKTKFRKERGDWRKKLLLTA
jgi:hypothetical protein